MTRVPALGSRGEGWVVAQFVLLGAAVVAGFAWNGAWTREARSVTTVVGVVLAVVGLVIAARGLLDLGPALTPFPRPRDDGALVTTGAYGLVRHPIYTGIILGAIGWGLFAASPAALLCAAALFVLFDLKSRREEAWLAERFPGYAAYRRRTRRLLPFIY